MDLRGKRNRGKKVCLVVEVGKEAVSTIENLNELILNLRNSFTGEVLQFELSRDGRIREKSHTIIEKLYSSKLFSRVIAISPEAIVLSAGKEGILYKVSGLKLLGIFSQYYPLEDRMDSPS